MNFDRILAIVGMLLGIAGIAIGVYVAIPTANNIVIAISGWISAIVTSLALSVGAFMCISRLERELIRSKDDQLEMANDLAQYRNISQALSGVINGNSSQLQVKKRKPSTTP